MFNKEKKLLSVIHTLNNFFITKDLNHNKANDVIQSLLMQNCFYKTKLLDQEHLDFTYLFILNNKNFKRLEKCNEDEIAVIMEESKLYHESYFHQHKIKSYVIIQNKVEKNVNGKAITIDIPVCLLLDYKIDNLFNKLSIDFAKIAYYDNFVSFYYNLKGVCIDTNRLLTNENNIYA